MILAIGNSSDNEFKAFELIRKAALLKGSKVLLFRQDNCLDGETIFFEVIDGVCNYFVKINEVIYNIDDFDSILYLHPHPSNEIIKYKPYEHANFMVHQFLELRKGIWTIFRDKKWVNDPWLIQVAENKPYQLVLASKVGFRIPDTVVTSDPDVVRRFYKDHDGKIITKIIIPTPILDHVIYTNRVGEEDIQVIDSVRMCPSIFQCEISKSYELRITVVGKKVFAAKVLSQEDEETKVDWRKKPKHNDYSVRFEPYTLPNLLREQILLFMKDIGLRYGCIDMIVTPDDEYVFLEINPSGQWYFVQMETNMDIASAIVDLVI